MLVPLIVLLMFGTATLSTLRIPTPDGVAKFRYNPVTVNPGDIKRWAQLSENISPYNFFLVPESLGMCIDGSADYEQCGSRDPNDPNFIHNAKVNISRIEKRIAELKSGRFPEELKPVVDYFLNILTTFLAEDVADLKYIQSGRVSDLAFVANGVDYGTACNDLRDKFQASEDKVAAFNKVRHDWHNCVNQAFTQNHGYSYPKGAWESFLKRYSIDQRFVPTEVN